MLYSLLKPLLFSVDAELAHEVCMELLNDLHIDAGHNVE